MTLEDMITFGTKLRPPYLPPIVSSPLQKEKTMKVNVTDGKAGAARLDLVYIFWPAEESNGGDLT